ncbi:MAG: peptidylprolyl isomerase [Ruminococcus sp.]|uniref:peptidylprolyl isomerase n=1 Tax=Ruminococcus sp. TaxID=41978 RepID=UPI0025F0ECAB|nr:peptidylprolyl isomerase [Ruminococcus sp.]MCR5541494.1 peptidylprolyl isomerase [Ruminococcus sp.]
MDNKKPKKNYYDVKRSRRFRIYFNFSMIALGFVLAFSLFSACQRMKSGGALDPDNVDLIQYQLPKDDAPVVVFETSEGNFTAVLYPDQAPKFVEYFEDLVNDGYYDNTYIFAVQKDVYFMGGSKSSDGTETSDTDTTQLEPEIHKDLWPFKGSLISYGDKGGSIFNKKIMSGSRILFVDTVEFTDEFKEELDSAGGNTELVETFKSKGGIPNFSQQYTIFGQVYDGFDAYDAVCGAEVMKEDDDLRPKKDIIIKKAYISTYGEHRNDSFFTLDADKNVTDAE